MEKENIGAERVIELLNKESGLLGLSGISNDMREIIKEKRSSKKARLALDVFTYRIKKYISAYRGILDGVDVVVFTGGIGENHPDFMKDICKGLLAPEIKVLSIPTDEELMIARDTLSIVSS